MMKFKRASYHKSALVEKKYIPTLGKVFLVATVIIVGALVIKNNIGNNKNIEKQIEHSYNQVDNTSSSSSPSTPLQDLPTYQVIRVVDGDTIKVNYDGRETSVRIIGVNTPEIVDPRTTVECFGQEASDYLKNLLTGKTVTMEPDPSQTDRDKYDRLLRYVYLNGEDVGYKIISAGYGYEYTYNIPYAKQEAYKEAQKDAEKNGRGLWTDGVCSKKEESSSNTASCNIKGNINSKGEKIYHMPGQKYYNSTIIDTSAGERWFCSETEARAAGWRKSKT